MFAIFRRLTDPVTYTRAVHLCLPFALVAIWAFISPDSPYLLALFVVPIGLLSVTRLSEGVQAQLFLTPRERGRPDATITAAPAKTWADRWRTVWWLEIRLLCAAALLGVGVSMVWITTDLIRAAVGAGTTRDTVLDLPSHWWWALLVPLPVAVVLTAIAVLGAVVTAAARRLLGPSPEERLRVLEARTEQLVEHNRLAREVHDSVGHALTAMVLQANAAATADDPRFTARALRVVEDTGRAALDDLDRVLGALRTAGQASSEGPTLTAASTLFEAARAAGVAVDVVIEGDVAGVPAPISREGYRILQESLTNVLRHRGRTSTDVEIRSDGSRLELVIRNPLSEMQIPSRSGNGLHGIRERVELLGGRAELGPHEGDWRVRVEIPIR
ncbi:sensor histidine kinase [Nocardia bovistercoris]|uniref:histidine kinase n=1 Tax=Nocardia bovistercoris TaxID=2785916 RepID=A0A931I763_9NOCA|nr:histidine kinase [Nocardia bovistercoris]MBH0775496.1 hypothetical protein [Nocardia bovistercoris]